jgi:hypothetical protein
MVNTNSLNPGEEKKWTHNPSEKMSILNDIQKHFQKPWWCLRDGGFQILSFHNGEKRRWTGTLSRTLLSPNPRLSPTDGVSNPMNLVNPIVIIVILFEVLILIENQFTVGLAKVADRGK